MTIEQLSVTLLQKGKSAQDTLKTVKRVFPGCKTSIKCIYYYSSKYKIKLSRSVEIDQEELKKALAA